MSGHTHPSLRNVAACAPVRLRHRVAVIGVAALLGACSTNAPERPGAPLERDGTSPVITDPAGVANDLDDSTND